MREEHLGLKVHDLLDNRLGAQETADAMAHIEGCLECRTRWEELRAAREALQSSPAGIDMSFAQQLLDRERMAEIAQRESKADARAASGHSRRPVFALMLVLVVLSAGVVGSYAAGAPQQVEPAFADAATSASGAESYISSNSMRSSDELASWAHPVWESTDLVPVEARVVRDARDREVLVLWLLAGADTIVVTEQEGSLADAVAEHFPTVDIGEVHAYLVNEDPLRVVWQTGDFVASAACECTAATLSEAVESFPTAGAPGIVERVGDGAARIVSVLTGD
ncbi:anti-sigma factor family protein [Demequina flava]|uniref:anti-sigma factor family protein n=1 Tax=Demequina flava TaxID=1095025 RepID=UPI000786244F|nr:hypothetical protein [Demequina flava]